MINAAINTLKIAFILLLLFGMARAFGQSKTKITLTAEKDSLTVVKLAEMMIDFQKLEKKWKFDFKIEFEKRKEEQNTIRFYPGKYLNSGDLQVVPQ